MLETALYWTDFVAGVASGLWLLLVLGILVAAGWEAWKDWHREGRR